MKRILPRLLILFFLPAHLISYSQNLTGIWRGYFISDDGEQYKLEFQIEQKGNAAVSGVSYSYLDTRFYGKATMTGRFDESAASFRIQEIKTVELKSLFNAGACIMNYDFTYALSGREEFLDGTFLGKTEDKVNPQKHTWGDCGGGTVHLRKVISSDFYIEPFLRGKINSDSLVNDNKLSVKNDTAQKKIKIPVVTSTKPPIKTNSSVVKKPVTINKKPAVKPNNNINTNISKINTPAKKVDSAQKIEVPVVKKDPPVLIASNSDVLKERENELLKTFIVTDPNVLVKLYDNGEIDGDSISVYLDQKLLLEHKMLTASPILIKLKMDEDNAEHELVMVAENLGRIPPNTSLMIVESGDKRYNVFITSTERKNAVVRFKYQKAK